MLVLGCWKCPEETRPDTGRTYKLCRKARPMCHPRFSNCIEITWKWTIITIILHDYYHDLNLIDKVWPLNWIGISLWHNLEHYSILVWALKWVLWNITLINYNTNVNQCHLIPLWLLLSHIKPTIVFKSGLLSWLFPTSYSHNGDFHPLKTTESENANAAVKKSLNFGGSWKYFEAL